LDSYQERKRFAVFHACTLILCLLIVLLAMDFIFLNNGLPHDNPFGAGMGKWLFLSYFVWGVIGSLSFDVGPSFFFGRFVTGLLMFSFPIVYLYNIWYLIFRRDKREDG
jgi:hypothetical protein